MALNARGASSLPSSVHSSSGVAVAVAFLDGGMKRSRAVLTGWSADAGSAAPGDLLNVAFASGVPISSKMRTARDRVVVPACCTVPGVLHQHMGALPSPRLHQSGRPGHRRLAFPPPVRISVQGRLAMLGTQFGHGFAARAGVGAGQFLDEFLNAGFVAGRNRLQMALNSGTARLGSASR